MKKLLVSLLLVTMLAGITTTALGEEAPLYGGPLDPFPEVVTVNVMREFNSNTWYPEGESQNDNILTRFYKEKLNIDYNVEWEVERGNLTQQLNLAIASNDLPDVFQANANQIYRMAQAGQIQPLTDAWNNYASQNCKDVLEVENMMHFSPVTIDGEIYGVPAPEDFALSIPFIWVRQDWLDNLGITDVKFDTIDDIIDLAVIFMTQDPDGNGQDDTFGIALDNTLDATLSAFGHASQQYANIYVEQEDGTLTFSDIQPGMKELIKKMNEMYEMGIFDPEFAVKDTTKMTERIAAGEVGILCQSFIVRNPFHATKQNNPDAEWTCFPIPPMADGSYAVGAEKSCFTWIVASADFEYPEVVVKQHNLWYELWQGIYAEYFHGHNLTDYAQALEDFKYYPPFWFDPPYKNLKQGQVFPTAWDNRDRDSIVSPETRKQYDRSIEFFENGNTTLYTGWSNMHLFYMAFPMIDQVYGVDNVVYDAFTGPVTDVIAFSQPQCDQVRLEWLTKFIVGNLDIDTYWDEYVDTWMRVGGDQLLDEINDWYAQTK